MASKKIITIFGATGAQGGSVVRSFLGNPDWTVRAVTRDATKDSAKKLASQGAEVVSADLNNAESLQKAVQGASAVFGVTDYWATMDDQKEFEQGKALADAVKSANVPHYIFSTLINVTKATNGKLSKVYHFDSKARVADYIREQGIPATFIMPGFFMSNLSSNFQKFQGPDGPYSFVLPIPAEGSAVPVFNHAQDTGKWVKAIALNRDRVLGKEIPAATQYASVDEIMAAFATAFPNAAKGLHHVQPDHDQYKAALTGKGMPEFIAEELLQNMRLMDNKDGGGYYAGKSLDESHALLGDEKPTSLLATLPTIPAFKDLN